MNFDLREEAARAQTSLDEVEFACWRPDGGPKTATFHRINGGFLIRFIDRADFLIALDDRIVISRPIPGLSAAALRDLYLNQVVPMIRSHQGELIIHASVVAIDGRAVGFSAPSGSGKSTLAAAFARTGVPFLSDDGVSLIRQGDVFLAEPSRPSFRLWQDSEAAVVLGRPVPDDCDDEKSLIAADEALPYMDKPLPLAALYFLGAGDSAEPVIADLTVPQSLSRLISHSFFLDGEDRQRIRRDFNTLAEAAERVPCFTLDYPRVYDQLPAVIDAVSRHMFSREAV
ncbi:MAG: hypothetical protein ABIT16_04705 [Croceibacterium sp.]